MEDPLLTRSRWALAWEAIVATPTLYAAVLAAMTLLGAAAQAASFGAFADAPASFLASHVMLSVAMLALTTITALQAFRYCLLEIRDDRAPQALSRAQLGAFALFALILDLLFGGLFQAVAGAVTLQLGFRSPQELGIAFADAPWIIPAVFAWFGVGIFVLCALGTVFPAIIDQAEGSVRAAWRRGGAGRLFVELLVVFILIYAASIVVASAIVGVGLNEETPGLDQARPISSGFEPHALFAGVLSTALFLYGLVVSVVTVSRHYRRMEGRSPPLVGG